MAMNDQNPGTISRRSFLKITAGATAATSLGGLVGCRVTAARRTVPVGVQLYSVRHELAADLPGTISRLSTIGFEGVEFADYFGRSAQEWRSLLDDNGLRCCGTHIYLNDLQGVAFDETVAFNQVLGNEFLIVRYLAPEQRSSAATFGQTIEQFNEIAERLAPLGMRTGFHTHGYMFETIDGKTLWDTLADSTREGVVMQLDTGNAAEVGHDPVALIRRHPGRTRTMHAKAFAATDAAAIVGEDDLDWPAIVDASESVGGIEWYILEYEQENPLVALEASLSAFRALTAR
jgi:sugar phosphate isomerase/epimerase